MTQIARRRLVAPLGISIVFFVLAVGCAVPMHETLLSRKTVSATGVTLSRTTLSLVKDTTSQLVATVVPASATNKRVLWSSGDKALATVSDSGLVTALGPSGKVTIKAVSIDGQFVATCEVTLQAVPIPLLSVSIDAPSLALALKTGTTSAPLNLVLDPPEATDVDPSTATWFLTGNTSLASVDANGAVTAGNTPTTGGVSVSATVKNSSGTPFTTPALPINITTSATPVNSITNISPNGATLVLGQQQTFSASVNSDATVQGVVWSVVSATPGGAITIDADGTVHANAVGSGTIKATAIGAPAVATDPHLETPAVTITVVAPLVDTITFSPNAVTVAVNGSTNLVPDVEPPQANQTVNWSSLDGTNKILVSPSGHVTVASGAPASAIIRATAADGSGKFGEVTIFVGNPVTSITIGPMSLGLNETSALSANTTPPGGTVKWIVGSLVAGTAPSVDPVTGVVTAGGAVGTVDVHAESLDGTVSSNDTTINVYDLNSSNPAVIPLLGSGEITQSNTLNNSGATMAIDQANGTVYIAYVDTAQVGYVQKAAQGSNTWTPVGGNFADDGVTTPPYPVMVDSFNHNLNLSLAIDQGIPYIADSDGGSNFQFPIVRQFVSGSWRRVGTGTVNLGAATYLSLAFDDNHKPFLGFSDQNASQQGRISVALFNGTSWGAINGNSLDFSNPNSRYSVVAYDASHSLASDGATVPSHNYYVAFDNQAGFQSLIDNFPASLFATVPAGQPMTNTDMTIQNGKLYLSYRDGSTGNPMLYTKTNTGTQVHNMDNTTTDAQLTSVAVDPRNGTAYVVYINTSGFLRVSKLDANAPANSPGTVIVSINDFIVNSIKAAFYVDNTGQGHLYVCYGLSGAGGVLVKDFKR